MTYLQIFEDKLDQLKRMSDEGRGKLLIAMMEYATTGMLPELDGEAWLVWPTFQQMIDKSRSSYEAKSRKDDSKSSEVFRDDSKTDEMIRNNSKSAEADRKTDNIKNKNKNKRKKEEKETPSSSSSPAPSETTTTTPVLDAAEILVKEDLSYGAFNAIMESGLVKTPAEAKKAAELVKQYGEDRVVEALKKSACHNARTLQYLIGVLEDKGVNPAQSAGSSYSQRKPDTSFEERVIQDLMADYIEKGLIPP